ncbi:hypothetical protein [Oceanidesulfovibrio marinus]|uniref:Uncharacterized protein n=1 Tax=Oceanidesulfovibrio marinus TaxID=370038 RepID=A0A6P1ZJ73_9BACT|nr:hypothetical protein [Oceanidesulfovibrio marinus]TVM35633.1 hypothetical protein DQK91_02915 [Oceanidesulfovibrio marinus]
MEERQLSHLTGKQVLRLAKDTSGQTNEEISERYGLAGVGCYFSDSSKDYPSYPLLPKLCAVMRSRLPLDWLEAKYQQHMREMYGDGESASDAPASISEVMDLLVKAQAEGAAAMVSLRGNTNADQSITAAQSKDVEKTVMRVMATYSRALEGLGAIAVSADYQTYDKPRFKRELPDDLTPRVRPSFWARMFRRGACK